MFTRDIRITSSALLASAVALGSLACNPQAAPTPPPEPGFAPPPVPVGEAPKRIYQAPP